MAYASTLNLVNGLRLVYVVDCEAGCDEDRHSWSVRVFEDRDTALEYRDKCQEYAKTVLERLKEIGFGAMAAREEYMNTLADRPDPYCGDFDYTSLPEYGIQELFFAEKPPEPPGKRFRVLRVLEYTYPSPEAMEADMSRWHVQGVVRHCTQTPGKTEREWHTIKSTTLPLEVVNE